MHILTLDVIENNMYTKMSIKLLVVDWSVQLPIDRKMVSLILGILSLVNLVRVKYGQIIWTQSYKRSIWLKLLQTGIAHSEWQLKTFYHFQSARM